jgi:dTDP-4-dehydrorhamnose 3,5-epimerase
MIFRETRLAGSFEIEMTPVGDERGYFVRTFCAREFEAHGLNPYLAQASFSFSARKGTLRGLHFQTVPHMEDKLIRCVRGAILDVLVDVRPESPTFGQWIGVELSDSNNRQLYAPRGFAHGFQTLTDDCIVAYQIAQFYEPSASYGVRWDDPDIGVDWPEAPTEMSAKDRILPLLKDVDPARLLSYDAAMAS